MDAQTLAQIVADYLQDRDDVADAYTVPEPSDPPSGYVGLEVTTQGGTIYLITVQPSERTARS